MSYLSCLLVCIALFSNISFAAASSSFKHGFVSENVMYAQELEAQKYIKELEAQENAISADEQKARTEIEIKMTKYKNSAPKLSEQARAAEEGKLQAEIGDLQQKFADRRTKLSNERSQKAADLEKKNTVFIQSIAEKGHYDVVQDHSGRILYLSERAKKNDFTQELVNQYNKAFPAKPTEAKPGAPAKPTVPKK